MKCDNPKCPRLIGLNDYYYEHVTGLVFCEACHLRQFKKFPSNYFDEWTIRFNWHIGTKEREIFQEYVEYVESLVNGDFVIEIELEDGD